MCDKDAGNDAECLFGAAEECPSASALLEALPLAVIILDEKGRVKLWNKVAETIFGWTSREALGRFLPPLPDRLREDFWTHFNALLKGESFTGLERKLVKKNGESIDISITASPLRGTSGRPIAYMGLLQDISAKKRLEREFQHAQKMEAVGRLAGGVAHDFNNILTAISGYAELLRTELAREDSRRADAEEIVKAGERAAELTRQLLAFSRQQILQARALDLNAVVAEIEKMLKRLIGEDIEVSASLQPRLGLVQADPGQIEQVIMNLVINSRDAMPRGGKIAIETADVELDAGYAQAHPGAAPGSYVMLAVSDTGCGMDAKTLARVFEPFFTTKEQGKGTGLGLATVYGIVKQSGGNIFVYSEPGRGTTFKVFLPRVEGGSSGASSKPAATPRSLQGSETLLYVEDDAAVRKLINRSLIQRGYTVLAAGDPEEAIRLFREHSGDIRLVVTDMVMPKMHGRELVRRLLTLRPNLKAIYMSGYTDKSVVQNDLLDAGEPFLQKPLPLASLAAKIREVLDGDNVA